MGLTSVRDAWAPRAVVKTADETVNNSLTLQDDDHLKFPINVNETWYVEALLQASTASANADWLFGWTGPAGSSASWGAAGGAGSQGSFQTQLTTASPTLALRTLAQSLGIGATAGVFGVQLQGWFSAVGTAGTIQLQWAQSTATVEDNKVLKNSFLRLRRVV